MVQERCEKLARGEFWIKVWLSTSKESVKAKTSRPRNCPAAGLEVYSSIAYLLITSESVISERLEFCRGDMPGELPVNFKSRFLHHIWRRKISSDSLCHTRSVVWWRSSAYIARCWLDWKGQIERDWNTQLTKHFTYKRHTCYKTTNAKSPDDIHTHEQQSNTFERHNYHTVVCFIDTMKLILAWFRVYMCMCMSMFTISSNVHIIVSYNKNQIQITKWGIIPCISMLLVLFCNFFRCLVYRDCRPMYNVQQGY